MTVSTTYAPVQYTGNGVTTVFAFPYKFFASSDLKVYLGSTLQGSGYAVTGGSGSTGNVTFSVAPTNGTVVTIELSLPYTQLDDYVENQAFPADTLETGLDKAAIRDQQLNNAVSRSLKFSSTSGSLVGVLPTPVDGKALIWDGTTGTIENGPDAADIAGASAAAASAIAAQAAAEAARDDAVAAAANLPLNKLDGTAAPTVNDDSGDGYSVGSKWYDLTNDEAYLCLDATAGAAVWALSTLDTEDLGSAAFVNVIDEDSFATDSSTRPPSQQSTKAYVDASKVVLAKAYAQNSSYTTLTTTIPFDNTIPQNTEGTQVLTVSITPKSTSSTIFLSGVVFIGNSVSSSRNAIAIFNGSTAGAIYAAESDISVNEYVRAIPFSFVHSPASTSQQTYNVRAGGTGTVYLNGDSSGARFGGVLISNITALEISS